MATDLSAEPDQKSLREFYDCCKDLQLRICQFVGGGDDDENHVNQIYLMERSLENFLPMLLVGNGVLNRWAQRVSPRWDTFQRTNNSYILACKYLRNNQPLCIQDTRYRDDGIDLMIPRLIEPLEELILEARQAVTNATPIADQAGGPAAASIDEYSTNVYSQQGAAEALGFHKGHKETIRLELKRANERHGGRLIKDSGRCGTKKWQISKTIAVKLIGEDKAARL